MTSTWIVFIVVITAVGITSCFSAFIFPVVAQANDFVSADNGTIRYENPTYGIEVMYPSTWKVEEKDFRVGDFVTNIVAFRPPFDSKDKSNAIEGRQLITFGILHQPQAYSLDYLANDFLDRARLESNDFKTISTTTRGILFDGKPAMKLIFEQEIKNQDFKRIVLGFLNGTDIYYAGYRMKDKNFDKFLPVFDSMVESYNFTGLQK